MTSIRQILIKTILNFFWNAIKRIGTLVRWPFLHKKYDVEEIYKQNWSGIIGIVFLSVAISIGLLLVA